MPGGDAAERTVRVAAAAGHDGRDAVIEAARRLARAHWPGQRVQVRYRGKVRGVRLSRGGAADHAGEILPRATVGQRPAQRDHRRLALLAADRIERREVAQQLLCRERREVAARRDVSAITLLA